MDLQIRQNFGKFVKAMEFCEMCNPRVKICIIRLLSDILKDVGREFFMLNYEFLMIEILENISYTIVDIGILPTVYS